MTQDLTATTPSDQSFKKDAERASAPPGGFESRPDQKPNEALEYVEQEDADDGFDERKMLEDDLDQRLDHLTLSPETMSMASSRTDTFGSLASSATTLSPTANTNGNAPPSKWTKAFQEVRHFAGGLMAHPYESTKHYSIMRHSHGIVYYKGAYTNLAITIFADRPLPEDRTLWLQRRGLSGKTGLKIGASFMGIKSAWIDITPSVRAIPAEMNPSDERAWQRDIVKFLKKAPKELRRHKVRETDVLRIPASADDGYLRVVLCAGLKGKKVLCPSPIFRLASTKVSPSSMRGASLTTMPLELGLKIGSMAAKTMAHNAISPVSGAISSQVQAYQPGFVATHAASAAYDASVAKRVDSANQMYEQSRSTSYQSSDRGAYEKPRDIFIGPESGPEKPYPIRFHGTVVPGNGWSRQAYGMPTANLSSVPDEILLRNEGIYFGWVSISTNNKLLRESLPDEWLPAIISFTPRETETLKVVHHKAVKIYAIYDFGETSLLNCTFSVMLMGFLRPSQNFDIANPMASRDAVLTDIYNDITVAQACLSRPEWAAETTLDRVKSASSSRTLTERYVDARTAGQKQLDKVPLHLAGVRSNGARLRDELIGTGGVYIPR